MNWTATEFEPFEWRLQGGCHHGDNLNEVPEMDANTPTDFIDELVRSSTEIEHNIFSMDYDRDAESWRSILDQAGRIAANRATPSWKVTTPDPPYGKIKELVP